MASVVLSNHAAVRRQQRGIPHDVLEDLLEYGSISHDHRGGEIVHFDKRAKGRCVNNLGSDRLRRLEKYFDVYAVRSGAGILMTVGHRYMLSARSLLPSLRELGYSIR